MKSIAVNYCCNQICGKKPGFKAASADAHNLLMVSDGTTYGTEILAKRYRSLNDAVCEY